MFKKTIISLLLLSLLSFNVHTKNSETKSSANYVTTLGAKYDSTGKLIPPDKYLLRIALKNYQEGFNQLSYSYFKKAAAFGNTVAQKYLGLMNIKALGVERNWPQGYAWIKLAARDKSSSHLSLEKQIRSILTPDELEKSKIVYEEIKENYDDLAALKRRDRWVQKQKLKYSTGSRVGSQTSNVYTYSADGRLLSANGTATFDEMKSFVEDFNYGYVEQGAIEAIDGSSDKTDK